MKTIIQRKYSTLLLLLVFVLGSAHARDQELSREVRKNYKVNATTELDVHNSFGKVHVNNWDKSEFDIKVEIIAESSSEEKAKKILDQIEINITESSSLISFRTELGKMRNKNNEGFEINYTIFMPAANKLSVKNSFGDVYLDDREGEADVEVAYGSLKAGDFLGRLDLKVSFGSADIGKIMDAEVEIKYSKADIQEANIVDLETGFSDVEIGKIKTGNIESKYGSLEIDEAGDLEVDIEYSDFEIDELLGSLIMDAGYVSGFSIGKVNPNFTMIDIDGKFGNYELKLPEGLKATFEGEFDFCDLNLRGVDIDFSYKVKDQNENYYKGTIGGKDAKSRIKIESSYGDCTLRSY